VVPDTAEQPSAAAAGKDSFAELAKLLSEQGASLADLGLPPELLAALLPKES
jgi:hypothetical protein